MNRKGSIWILSTVALAVIIVILIFYMQAQSVKPNWNPTDNSVPQTEYAMYTMETEDYDYNTLAVRQVVDELLKKSDSPEEYVANVGEWTYHNVRYDFYLLQSNAVTSHCINNRASDIIKLGRGICSTMSKTAIALSRGSGIMAKQASGCILVSDYMCSPLPESYQNLAIDEMSEKLSRKPIVSPTRTVDGKLIYGGGLHSWVEVFLPNRGWTILEATTGLLFDGNCTDYIKECNPTTREGMCYTNNATFAGVCDKFI